MGAAARSKPVREALEVDLIYLIEDRHHGLLDDLVFQGRDSDWMPDRRDLQPSLRDQSSRMQHNRLIGTRECLPIDAREKPVPWAHSVRLLSYLPMRTMRGSVWGNHPLTSPRESVFCRLPVE